MMCPDAEVLDPRLPRSVPDVGQEEQGPEAQADPTLGCVCGVINGAIACECIIKFCGVSHWIGQ